MKHTKNNLIMETGIYCTERETGTKFMYRYKPRTYEEAQGDESLYTLFQIHTYGNWIEAPATAFDF